MKMFKPLRLLSHRFNICLVKRMRETEDREAQLDTQVKEALVTIMSDSGKRKPFSNILVSILHEIGHEIDYATGHEVFSDKDEETRNRKENALDSICEIIAQILLDNNLLNPDWLKSLKDEINRTWEK